MESHRRETLIHGLPQQRDFRMLLPFFEREKAKEEDLHHRSPNPILTAAPRRIVFLFMRLVHPLHSHPFRHPHLPRAWSHLNA